MTDTEKAPATLSGRLNRYKPNQAVRLVSDLCAQLVGDTDSFHGAIWPGNISLPAAGAPVLGAPSDAPVSQRDADEVEFLAPEFFWDGEKSAASDVYSLGLLLYALCKRGRMPFQPQNKTLTDADRSAALRRRMKGETVSVTGKLSAELKAVLSKALAYDPEKRFITAAEMLAALAETEEAKAAEAEGAPVAAAPVEAAFAETAPAAEEPAEAPAAEIPAEEETLPAEEPAAEETLAETPDSPEGTAPAPAEDTAEAPAVEETNENTLPPDIRRYTVQKDFEHTSAPRRTAAGSRRKKRVSPLVPILAILAAGIILVVVLILALGVVNDPVNKLPDNQVSEPFTITPSEVDPEEQAGDASEEPNGDTAEEPAETEEPEAEHLGSPTVNGMDVTPANDTVRVTESGAKLRTGPSTSYDVADSLPKDAKLARTGTIENWSQVQYNGGEYYIANTLIAVVEGSEGTAGGSTSGSTSGSDQSVVVKTEANIRSGAGTGYSKLGVAKVGTKFTVTGKSSDGKWYQISYNGKTAYINRNMVSLVEASAPAASTKPAETTPAPETSAAADGSIGSVVVKTEANIRSGASANHDKLGVAKVGTKLTVTDVSSDGKWYQVSYNGKTGYINRNMVTVESLELNTTATVTGEVNIRSGPGSSYTKLGVAKVGDTLSVTGMTGSGWYKINYNGKTGYVAGNFVTVK